MDAQRVLWKVLLHSPPVFAVLPPSFTFPGSSHKAQGKPEADLPGTPRMEERAATDELLETGKWPELPSAPPRYCLGP